MLSAFLPSVWPEGLPSMKREVRQGNREGNHRVQDAAPRAVGLEPFLVTDVIESTEQPENDEVRNGHDDDVQDVGSQPLTEIGAGPAWATLVRVLWRWLSVLILLLGVLRVATGRRLALRRMLGPLRLLRLTFSWVPLRWGLPVLWRLPVSHDSPLFAALEL